MNKKLLFTTLGILISFFAFSQNYTLTDMDNSSDITNQSITKTGTVGGGTISHSVSVTNNLSTSATLKAFKREMQMANNSSISICFAGQCYPPSTDTSGNSVTIGAGQTETANALVCDFYPDGAGTSIVDYVIFNVNDLSDSVNVRVTYDISTGINGNYVSNSLIAYPNPANNQISFKYDLKSKKSYINIYNVVGEKINTINLNSQQGVYTLNTSNFNSGIYFYDFNIDGKKVSTNKFIVKH